MKKLITRLILAAVLLGLTFSNVATAQRHVHPYPRHYHSHRVLDALDAAEHIGRAAMFGMFLHGLDDYTGIRFGYNAASLRTDMRNVDFNSDFTPGVNIGFVFGWHLGNTPLILEPGLFYSMKGGDINGKFQDVYCSDATMSARLNRFTNKTTMHAFEIPLVLKCQLPLTSDNYVSLQPFAGGFLSFGFGGQTKYTEGDSYHEKFDTFDYMCNTDAGLRMGVGMNVGQFYLEAAYDLGLVNLPENGYDLMGFDDFHDTMRSNTISFNAGFNF